MPVLHTLDSGLLRMSLVGTYDSADVGRAFLAAISDPACPPEVALLIDVTRSESLATRSIDEIRAVSEFLGPYAARIGARCAVLATSDIHYGLTRMGTVFSESAGVESRVFRQLDEALEWLGIPGNG